MKNDIDNLYCFNCGKIWIDPNLKDNDCKCTVNLANGRFITKVPNGSVFIHHEEKRIL